MTNTHRNRVDILDYARFFAALLVMSFHYFYGGIKAGLMPTVPFSGMWSSIFQFGYVGVSLFFMISGYVIFYSAQGRTAAQFATARALRLYPAFVAALLMTTCFVYLFGSDKEAISPLRFIQNLSMLATDLGGEYVDPSYWTLRLEILFYGMVCLIILVGAAAHLEHFFLIWPLFILVAQFTPLSTLPLLSCDFAYFAAGALFSMRRTKAGWAPVALIILCYLESLYGAGIFTDDFGTRNKVVLPILTLFYLFFALLNKPAILQMELPAARFVGALTYPVYLVHQVIGCIVIRNFQTDDNRVVLILTVMGSMLFFAYVLHRVVEINGRALAKHVIDRLLGAPISWAENTLQARGNKKAIGTDPLISNDVLVEPVQAQRFPS